MRRQKAVIAVIVCAAVAVSAQTKIACIGNSITYGYGLSDTTKRYPSVLRQLLGTSLYTVQNDGVNSTTMSKKGNVPYWTQGKLAQVFTLQPAIVTIMLGTNDTKPMNWDSLGYGTQFKTDYLAMIDTLAAMASKPKIYVALPVPVFYNPTQTWGIRDSVVQEIIPIIQQVAAQRPGVVVVDANTPLKGFSQYFATDGVHPNAAGEDTIAHVFYRAIIATAYTVTPAPAQAGRQLRKTVRRVFNGSNVPALFAGCEAGQRYELRVFDARGVMTGKFAVDASPASLDAVRKTLAKACGMRLVEIKKL
jgi:acyl-CoA thioesterase-1